MNRPQRRPAEQPPARPPGEPKPALPSDHSGEGSASALESLRKLEDSRMPQSHPADPGKDDPDPAG